MDSSAFGRVAGLSRNLWFETTREAPDEHLRIFLHHLPARGANARR
jgi:hypothetical protein